MEKGLTPPRGIPLMIFIENFLQWPASAECGGVQPFHQKTGQLAFHVQHLLQNGDSEIQCPADNIGHRSPVIGGQVRDPLFQPFADTNLQVKDPLIAIGPVPRCAYIFHRHSPPVLECDIYSDELSC